MLNKPAIPYGSRSLRLPGFQDKRQITAVKLSALGTVALTPKEILVVLICIKG